MLVAKLIKFLLNSLLINVIYVCLFQATTRNEETTPVVAEPIPSTDLDVGSSPIRLLNCVIKGYHVYKIRPPMTDPPSLLLVDREYTNIHDMSACLVWIPKLETFDENMHNMSTDNKRQLVLSDVAGLPLGHVPRELAPCFREVLDKGGTVHAEPCGEPAPSSSPWPEQHEAGGGVNLPCHYVIKTLPSSYDQILSLLRQTVSQMKAGSAMTIVT